MPHRLLTRLTAAAGAVLLGLVALAPGAAAHDGSSDHARRMIAAADGPAAAAPPLTSDNVSWVSSVPGTAGISGCFTPTAPYFVTSGLDSVSVFDVSQPRQPALTGKLVNVIFENEAMTCGERRVNGELRRFVLLGVDLVQVSPDDIDHTNAGEGNELIVVDVTDPAAPTITSRTPVSSSTHTVTCLRGNACRYAYSAGSDGRFSVIDLRDLANPVEVDFVPGEPGSQGVPSPAIGWAGHSWDVDAAGYGLHTGAGGAAIFDLTSPLAPRLVAKTAASAESGGDNQGYNDFILHNSWRPNPDRFQAGMIPSVQNGNVLLVTEEDYEDTNCSTAGSFQTWQVRGLQGASSRVVPLDKVELADLGNYPVPVGAFCSAHWFDYHPAGFVAVGYYGGGFQVVDVRNARDLRSAGYALTGVSEVWDAYWVPRYTAGGIARGKTNLVYTVDVVRGLDVYEVDLPGQPTGAGAAIGDTDGASAAEGGPSSAAVALALLALPLAVAVRRRATTHPRDIAG